MADIARKTKRYPTDLTDEEWARIKPLLPEPPKRGRKVSVDLREMLNAIRYMARSGGGWRMLPTDFGPWQTVYWWFRRFVRRMLFQTIHDVSLMLDRERAEREASCMVPGCGGTHFHHALRDDLWARFFTEAPARQRRSVAQFNYVKRA
ncbi:hypothetical protein AcidC75_24640 [Acidisoma sp. C75]